MFKRLKLHKKKKRSQGLLPLSNGMTNWSNMKNPDKLKMQKNVKLYLTYSAIGNRK